MNEEKISFNLVKVFENYEVVLSEYGHTIVKTEVVEHSLNLYGNTHGGYLFTLCDSIGGLTARSTGVNVVTLQASINYIRPAQLHEILTIEGRCIHDGKKTKVIEVTIRDGDDREMVRMTEHFGECLI